MALCGLFFGLTELPLDAQQTEVNETWSLVATKTEVQTSAVELPKRNIFK